MLEKNVSRAYMFGLLYKMCGVALMRGIRIIVENPWAMNTYLKQNVFLKEPSVIDMDRTRRGDYYIKPTAYWFFNCEPTNGMSFQKPKERKKSIIHCKPSGEKSLCSEERSMISPDYARNFICDFILGKTQKLTHAILQTMDERELNNEKFVCCFASFLTEAMRSAEYESE